MEFVLASRRFSVARAVFVSLFCLLGFHEGGLRAQQPAAGRPGLERFLQIRQFNALGRRQRVRTPTGRTAGRPSEWLEIKTVYDYAAPEWIDELAFRYHIMTALPAERGEARRYSLYRITVLYADIQQGRGRSSTVFLRPAALLRFGEPVAAAVEILHEGKLVAEASEENVPFPEGEKWYRNPAVVDSKAVTRRDGYLLNRAQSPWALIALDDHEHIKP